MRDKSPMSGIQVMIIDTRQFPKDTFVKDREIIEALFPNVDIFPSEYFVFNLRKRRTKRGKDYYFGEYLSQGDLNLEGRCVQTTIDTLIKLGLFDVQDAFGNEEGWRKWADGVLELREPFKSSVQPETATETEVARAFTAASSAFGDDWAPPIALMLLTLKPRREDDPSIIEGMTQFFTRKKERTL